MVPHRVTMVDEVAVVLLVEVEVIRRLWVVLHKWLEVIHLSSISNNSRWHKLPQWVLQPLLWAHLKAVVPVVHLKAVVKVVHLKAVVKVVHLQAVVPVVHLRAVVHL